MADDADRKADDTDQKEEAMPALPECIGLDYDDIRAMLASKHQTVVRPDDPMLMIVSILNAYITELEKVSRKHNEATGKVMAKHTVEFVKSVKTTTESLGEALKENSVEAIRNIFDRHAAALQALKINSRWCAAIVAVSAVANVVVLALR